MDSDPNANINPTDVAEELIVTRVLEVEDCPPSDEVVMNPSRGPPLSNDSLFAKVKEVHKSRKNIIDFLQKAHKSRKNILVCSQILIVLLFCLLYFALVVILSFILPLSMIYFGWTYLYDCPEEEHIPIYLLVSGLAFLFRYILKECLPLLHIMDLFLTAWFVAGTIWVYKVYEPNYDPSYGKYCNKIMYMFAFWYVSVSYIIIGIIIITSILCVIFAKCYY